MCFVGKHVGCGCTAEDCSTGYWHDWTGELCEFGMECSFERLFFE